jgi:hypothetical protein
MTIKAPAWCENAIPTINGWTDPQTGEVYASGRFTVEQIAEFHGQPAPQVLTEVPTPRNNYVKTPTMLTEAPVGGKSLEEMTKIELEALGRTHGIELDRRKSKTDLIDEVSEVIDL